MTREREEQDPVGDKLKAFDAILGRADVTVESALGGFSELRKARREAGGNELEHIVFLRDVAESARAKTASLGSYVGDAVAAVFSTVSNSYNDGVNAAVAQMGRVVPSVKRERALEGPVRRTDISPAQRRRA
ncbi:MAG TPA: hypothetical protein VM077_05320 [Candidatus Limnocylindrales bacterium]|nr:hypothetical protein [Candidatus Limnocylindrales bacterium]